MGDKTTVKVDKKLVKDAHKVGLNVSKVCENALEESIRRLKGSDCHNTDSNCPRRSGSRSLCLPLVSPMPISGTRSSLLGHC
jgi:hypothetical protein